MSIELAQVYTDFSALGSLRAQARSDREAAVDEVARQFESLFTQMMLRSMRQASFGGGLFDSQQSRFYRDMYDQQLAMELGRERGLGLAEVIKRQIGQSQPVAAAGHPFADYRAVPVSTPMPSVDGMPVDPVSPTALDGTPGRFVAVLWPAAEQAAAELGLPPEALLAQAALETGWGAQVMPAADGRSSHNLFGIKADRRWDGERVTVTTLEYRDGVAVRTRADFRAYADWAASFADYVRFIRDNPRYRQALEVTDEPARYFEALQRAGYATDPHYADKIQHILERGTLQTAARDREGARTG